MAFFEDPAHQRLNSNERDCTVPLWPEFNMVDTADAQSAKSGKSGMSTNMPSSARAVSSLASLATTVVAPTSPENVMRPPTCCAALLTWAGWVGRPIQRVVCHRAS